MLNVADNPEDKYRAKYVWNTTIKVSFNSKDDEEQRR
jgi:hypothetical protein